MKTYDVIVLGLGGMGSAAAYHLARRGLKVLGLEQYPLVHSRGSSHGHTRIIRTAYYEHPDYIPLVKRAFGLWHDLEQVAGRHLLTKCDCLSVGPTDGELIRGVSTAATRLDPGAVTTLSTAEIQRRYPFRLPEHFEGRIEQDAGFLYVEDCVDVHLDAARHLGADLHADEPAIAWAAANDRVEVTTAKGTYSAAKLVITAGAWATHLLSDLGVPLRVMRQTPLWFTPKNAEDYRRDRFPIFLVETPHGEFYGLPMIDARGVKIARHYAAPELASPDGVDWAVHNTDVTPVREFLDEFLPNKIAQFNEGQVCMYTLTPDRHFVVDRHPHYRNVAIAAGFSGHGFKFAPAIGEMLAGLLFDATAPLPMFSASRFAVEARSVSVR